MRCSSVLLLSRVKNGTKPFTTSSPTMSPSQNNQDLIINPPQHSARTWFENFWSRMNNFDWDLVQAPVMWNRMRFSRLPIGLYWDIWHHQLSQHSPLEPMRLISERCKNLFLWIWIMKNWSCNNRGLRTCLPTSVQVRTGKRNRENESNEHRWVLSVQGIETKTCPLWVYFYSSSHAAPWWRRWPVIEGDQSPIQASKGTLKSLRRTRGIFQAETHSKIPSRLLIFLFLFPIFFVARSSLPLYFYCVFLIYHIKSFSNAIDPKKKRNTRFLPVLGVWSDKMIPFFLSNGSLKLWFTLSRKHVRWYGDLTPHTVAPHPSLLPPCVVLRFLVRPLQRLLCVFFLDFLVMRFVCLHRQTPCERYKRDMNNRKAKRSACKSTKATRLGYRTFGTIEHSERVSK